ncbi:MAG: hypothetical protein ACKO0M_10595 [Cyanobium sp.]
MGDGADVFLGPTAAGGDPDPIHSGPDDCSTPSLHSWLPQLFEDVALIDEPTARASSLRTLVLLSLSDQNGLSWFSTPLSWSERQELSLTGLFPFRPQTLMQETGKSGGPDLGVHHLALGPRARVRHVGLPLQPGTAFGGRSASGKTVTAVVPRQGEGLILKQSRLVANLRREIEALRSCPTGLLAPRHLGEANAPGGGLVTAQTLLPGQPLHWLGSLTEDHQSAVIDALQRLVHPHRTTSCVEQARSLEEELACAPLPPAQRRNLAQLLAGINDSHRWPSSRLHGDLKPMNLLLCPLERDGDDWRCGIGLLDWEFSRPCGLGVTDVVRLLLDSGYREASSLAELLRPSRLAQVQQALSQLDLPGAAGPLDQLLRLHVVTHALDRLVSFGNAGGERMRNLRNMLTTPWPL